MQSLDVVRWIWRHPANRGGRARAVGRSVAWQAYKRITRRARDIDVFDGLRMRCHPGSVSGSLMIYTNGLPDYDDMLFVQRYLRPGDAFVDVGANVGTYTLLAASCVGAEGRVVAFEPGERAYAMLEENVALNDLSRVETHYAAVGEDGREVRFLQGSDTTNRIARGGGYDEAATTLVPGATLDEALAGREFAMGKIDIEGAEPVAFAGARRMLAAANPPVWLVEFKDHLLRRYGSSAAELAGTLRDAGYEFGYYDADAGRLHLTDEPRQELPNVIVVHGDAVGAVRARIGDPG